MGKTCSFFGHRKIINGVEIAEEVKAFVEKLIVEEEFTTFLFGEFGEFDEVCFECVSKLKEKYSMISRVCCVADEKELRKGKSQRYLQCYDEIIYLPLSYDYWYKRIYYRNCEIIEKSDFIIFYAEERVNSGAYKALRYAQRKKKKYMNFF